MTAYTPGRRSTILYTPSPSVTAVRTFSIRAVLDASTVTPGSTAPVVSFTTPPMVPPVWLWADVITGSSSTTYAKIKRLAPTALILCMTPSPFSPLSALHPRLAQRCWRRTSLAPPHRPFTLSAPNVLGTGGTTSPSGTFHVDMEHECEFMISHFTSVPCSSSGLSMSNSTENASCADAAASSKPTGATRTASVLRTAS